MKDVEVLEHQLRRELHEQAAEAATWPPPDLTRLRALRRRRQQRRSGAVALLAAALVGVAVVVPRVVAEQDHRSTPARPLASPSPTSPTSPTGRPWTGVTCPPPSARDCAAPDVIRVDGRAYAYRSGGDVPARYHGHTSRALALSVRGTALLLVGATGSGPDSRLSVRVGRAGQVPLEPGRLTLLSVHAPRGSVVRVVVREDAHRVPDETLTIGVYRPLR